MGYTVNVRTDTNYPGVETVVKQTINFASLEPNQLRRCVRAVERGHMSHSGYVQGLVRAAAKHLGIAAPIVITPARGGGWWGQTATVSPLPEAKYKKAFADLIALSDVRWKLQLAQMDSGTAAYHIRNNSRSGWTSSYRGDHLSLYGWKGCDGEMRERVSAVLKAAGYGADLKKLAAFIETKPEFEV